MIFFHFHMMLTHLFLALERSVEISDNMDLITQHLLGSALMTLGQYEKARACFQVQYKPSVILQGQCFLLESREAFESGRYRECAKLLKEGYAFLNSHSFESNLFDRTLADLLAALMWIPYLAKDYEEAAKNAISIYTRIGCTLQAGIAHVHLFVICRKPENLGHAISLLQRSLRKTKMKDSVAWNALGSAYFFSNQVALAQHCFISSIRCNPTGFIAWTNLGYLYLSQHDKELALKCFSQSCILDSEQPGAWIGQGLCKMSESLSQIHHAFLASNWMSPIAHKVYATKIALLHPIESELAAQKYLEWRGDEEAMWNIYGCLLEMNRNRRCAIEAYRQSLKLNRSDPQIILNLARALSAEDPGTALQLYRKIDPMKNCAGNSVSELCTLLTYSLAAQRHMDGQEFVKSMGAILSRCEAQIVHLENADSSKPLLDERNLLAQLYYTGGSVSSAQSLVEKHIPSCACAIGMLTGNEALVAASFEAAQRIDPTSALYLTSVYQLLHNQVAEALKSLQRAIFINPGSNVTWKRLAECLARYSQGKSLSSIAQGIAQYQRENALIDDASPSYGLRLATVAHLIDGDSRKAFGMAQRQLFTHPTDLAARRQLLMTMQSVYIDQAAENVLGHQSHKILFKDSLLGKFNAGLEVKHDITEQNVSEITFTHLLSSVTEILLKQPKGALLHAEEATRAVASCLGAENLPWQCFVQLGRCFLMQDAYPSCVEMCKRAISLDAMGNQIGLLHEYIRTSLYAGWQSCASEIIQFAKQRYSSDLLVFAQCIQGRFSVDSQQELEAMLVTSPQGTRQWQVISTLLALCTLIHISKTRSSKLISSVTDRDLIASFEHAKSKLL
jgi:tetratricopeptide (TPR) repeat protein